jgi:hypothetical protein
MQRRPLVAPLRSQLNWAMSPRNAWRKAQSGKIGYILLWLLGVPIPILILIYLLRGCT